MERERVTLSDSSETNPSFETISILVVDDDTTCLSIVAAILKKWKYEVVTVKHPMDALCTLRIKSGSFDLVVSDVHMPDMNGFELQQQIDAEFNLPVVLMSADDKEAVVLKGIECGAAFFILKPIAPEDLKDLWQYAVTKKKGKAILEETETVQKKFLGDKGSNKEVGSALSTYGNRSQSKKDSKRKDKNDMGSDDNVDSTPKKAKVVWTNALHNRFLEAIRIIGLDRAVPKKILEHMKVPGLTRENIASHLQKYRIFLNQVSDRIQSATEKNLTDSTFGSRFLSENPTLNKPQQQQMSSSFCGRAGVHVPQAVIYLDQESSSSNSVPRSGYGQSSLLRDQGISSGLMTGTNSMQTYQPLAKATQKSQTNGLSNYDSTTFRVRGPYSVPAYVTMGTSSNSSLIQKLNCSNNYFGYKVVSGEQPAESNGFDGDNGMINGIQNDNYMTTAPMSCGNSGNLAPKGNTPLPLLPPTPTLHNTLVNGENDYYTNGFMNNASSFDNIFPLQPFSPSDLSSTFLNQVNVQSPNQQQDEQEDPNFGSSLYPNHKIGNNPLVNQQSNYQQHGNKEAMVFNFGKDQIQSDQAYFPWFDQNPSQEHCRGGFADPEDYNTSLFKNTHPGSPTSPSERDDEEFLMSVFGSGPYEGDDNLEG